MLLAQTRLDKKYKLLVVGAGQVFRIFNQLEQFPIDIIGNYGMQYGKYNAETKSIDIVFDNTAPYNHQLRRYYLRFTLSRINAVLKKLKSPATTDKAVITRL